MGFYKDVHKGDKFTPNYQRENDINRMLNTFSGFSTPPRTKQGSSSDSVSGLEMSVYSVTVNDVEYWKVQTEYIYIQHRCGITTTRFLYLYIPKYTETATGTYASLILYPRAASSYGTTYYSVCYYLSGYATVPTLNQYTGRYCVPCESEYDIMLNKPIACLGVLDTQTGEITNNYPNAYFNDLYYHGQFEGAVVNSADGFQWLVRGGRVYFGSSDTTISSTYKSNSSYSTSYNYIALQATWDGQNTLTCSIVSTDTEDTYVANIELDEWGEYPSGINIVGRVLP